MEPLPCSVTPASTEYPDSIEPGCTTYRGPTNESVEPLKIRTVPGPEVLINPEKGDTERDTKGTPKNEKKGVSLSLCIVTLLRSEPDHTFVIRDVVDRVGGNYESVKRELLRLSSTGKGSGPVKKVKHGLYRYAPEKEQESLQALTRSGNWKIENLVFVPLGVYPTPVPLFWEPENLSKGTPSDPCLPTPHPGYPKTLLTGQQIAWEDYQNGNQVIRISAKGAPPMSPDAALLIIDGLGIDDSWKCISMELNIDSYKHRIDFSYSLLIAKGLLLKAYQHGYNARIEIANRRDTSMQEVTDLFHAIAGGIDGKEALERANALESRLAQNEKDTRLALTIARQVRDRENKDRKDNDNSPGKDSREPKHPSTFKTAAALKQEQARQQPGRSR